MKPSEATSDSSASTGSSPVRLILLGALVLLLGARLALAGSTANSTTTSATYASAASYTAEVFQALDGTPCRFIDDSRLRSRLEELPSHVESWRQTARVEPSELLRSLKRIAELTNCQSFSSVKDIQPIDTPRKALRDELERALRSGFARLRRAQEEGDRKGAHASIVQLQDLLEHHQGPLTDHVGRLERLYREE